MCVFFVYFLTFFHFLGGDKSNGKDGCETVSIDALSLYCNMVQKKDAQMCVLKCVNVYHLLLSRMKI